MSRKDKENLLKEEILRNTYNLILDENITQEERNILLSFKNRVEIGTEFEKALKKLSEELRCLALGKLNNKEVLSKQIDKFYMDISSIRSFKKNLVNGLACSTIFN
ncbi:MAG: bacteriocin immunity protein [Sarcina sp.]